MPWLLIDVRGSSPLWVALFPDQVVLVYEKRIAKIDSGGKPTSTVLSYIVSASNPLWTPMWLHAMDCCLEDEISSPSLKLFLVRVLLSATKRNAYKG